MKILIVEDEQKIGNYLKQGLTEAGFVVDLVCSGLDGRHMALTESYELIILDVMLPDIDGWQVMKSLQEANKNIPVLFWFFVEPCEARESYLDHHSKIIYYF